MNVPQRVELVNTICELFDGGLAPERAAQLSQRLFEDEESYSLYTQLVRLDVGLAWSCGTRPKPEALAEVPVLALSSNEASSLADRTHAKPTTYPSRIGRLPSNALFFSWPILQRVALVGLCFYGAFALVAWNLRSFTARSDSISSRTAAQSAVEQIAVLTRADDARWKSLPSVVAGEQIERRTLQVRTGLAEIRFAGGTNVIVQGPAEFDVHAAGRGFLRRGKLVAVVPPQAIGFTVGTPTGEIVDLGTEFGVEVDSFGTTDVQVIQGKVELRHKNDVRTSSTAAVTVAVAGEARRMAPAALAKPGVVEKALFEPSRFAAMTTLRRSQWLPVAGAMESSSESPRRIARHLCDSSGMRGDAHCNFSDGAMWVSDYGKTRNEFVLFDFGCPNRLESMKVWNYNDVHEARNYRGLAQADIYVSTSGRDDPLSRPDAWTLVVKDQSFQPADGTDSYSTPDTVPLGNVVARFVGIVVKKTTGDSQKKPVRDWESVGLSEVRFYGERLHKKTGP